MFLLLFFPPGGGEHMIKSQSVFIYFIFTFIFKQIIFEKVKK